MYLCTVNNILAEIMPRQERLQSATDIYHVMLRGVNKQDIFEDAEDCLQMTDYCAGIRQLSRLTGVSYGVIHKLWTRQKWSQTRLLITLTCRNCQHVGCWTCAIFAQVWGVVVAYLEITTELTINEHFLHVIPFYDPLRYYHLIEVNRMIRLLMNNKKEKTWGNIGKYRKQFVS